MKTPYQVKQFCFNIGMVGTHSRMLSPDNYVQSPNSSQSFNRYSYCWNTPLKYTDPSGEIIFTLATLIAAPFTSGASLTFLPAAIGADIGMWQGGTMANGTMNPTKWDYSSGKTWGYMAAGGAIGAGSSYIGGAGTTAIFKSTSIGANHVLFGATSGAISGAVSGFGMGGLSGVPQNGKWSWSNAWKGAGMGAAGGFVMGGVSTAIGNKIAGRHWWNGKTLAQQVKFEPPGPGDWTDETIPDELYSSTNPELGTAEFPGGNKYDISGNFIESSGTYAAEGASNVYKHSFKYAERVRLRGVQDPTSHNFPYSFDDAILATKPMLKDNGYKIYQLNGTLNGKNGVFEIGLTKYGIIDHRFFRTIK